MAHDLPMAATGTEALRLCDILKRDLSWNPLVTGITADSRKAGEGMIFCALPGTQRDGRDFIPDVVKQKVAAVLTSEDTPRDLPGVPMDAPLVRVMDVRRAYALAARAFYGDQPRICLAVTGTNGKTSVATFCRQIFAALGHVSASMGTLGTVISTPTGDEIVTPPGLTTPDAGDLARLLADLARRGVTHVTLEASSHGVDQRRLDGVSLTAAGFTNLTQDHLDYHGDMDTYRSAKLRLFENLLPRGKVAVLNADSEAYGAFAASAIMAGQGILSVGERGRGLALIERRLVPEGQYLVLEHDGQRHECLLPLAGAFQASNALVAVGLCLAAGEALAPVLEALSRISGAEGRLQRIGTGPRGGEAYIDYAHTPDGLETVLKALRPHASGRLICVFGCGGDRDRTKRPIMGEIAVRLSDVAIVTDDNPRSETPAAIRQEILTGAAGAHEIGDRLEAILTACALMREGDVLVVAGKGHEQGQIVGTEVLPFDDASATRLGLEKAAQISLDV